MFESFGRGFRMIGASIKMAWQDRRLMLPSVLIVLTNIFFGMILAMQAAQKMPHNPSGAAGHLGGMPAVQMPTRGMLHGHGHMGVPDMVGMAGLNGPLDQSGLQAMSGAVMNETTLMFIGFMCIWWLTNRFLEGVTTALVYSHLTDGKGSGTFGQACGAVLQSLPAIIMLGMVTLIAKKLAGWMRNKRGSGVFGFGVNFLAGIIEVFWTLAGHLILPAIVIEGTSFWGGLKRADKIASGNLLTIGVGEVGVDVICKLTTWLLYSAGMAGFGYAWYAKIGWQHPAVIAFGIGWALSVVVVTALSIYIRSAFYTCLYVWAIESEAVQDAERVRVKAPGPLGLALA